MFNLHCTESFCLGPEVYVLKIIPLLQAPTTISSDQDLCVFNPLNLRDGPVAKLPTSHGNLTCAATYSAGNATVATAGEDGSVALWDLRLEGKKAQVARLVDNQIPVLSLACSSDTCSVVAGTELQSSQASVLIWDVRATPKPRHKYQEIHSDDVTELNFHPTDPNILLSSSTDGLVNICDTRLTDEDDVVLQTFNHHASISHAAFLTDTDIFALSHDERFATYSAADAQEKGVATADFGDLRKRLPCQYVADVSVKAQGAGAVVGAGTHEKEMFEIIHMTKHNDTWSLNQEHSVGLPGAHGSEIVRSFCFYDEAQTVFTVGEDGCIKAWK